MKVLFIGHYRDGTGWSQSAIDYILSLDAVGIDVVPRAIKLNNTNLPIHPRVEELESKSSKGCDFCIQHVLPHHMMKSNKFKKNIGIFLYEGTMLPAYNNWARKLYLMDCIWCPTLLLAQLLKNNCQYGIDFTKKVDCVPQPTDITKYEKQYQKPRIKEIESTKKFYFIGENIPRKNIQTLIKCFHLAFDYHQPVSLVIKTNTPGKNAEESRNDIFRMIAEVKNEIGLYKDDYKYHKEVVITERLSEEELYGLHQYCDYFVSASNGEGWCIPAFDAVGFNKGVIMSCVAHLQDSGMYWPVQYNLSRYGKKPITFNNLYRADELSNATNEHSLIDRMQQILNHSPENEIDYADKDFLQAHSYSVIGFLMRHLLNE